MLPMGVPGLITSYQLTIKKVLLHGAIAMAPHPLAAHGCPWVNHQLSTHHQEGAAPWYRYHVPPSSCFPVSPTINSPSRRCCSMVPLPCPPILLLPSITNYQLTIKKVLLHGAVTMSPHPLASQYHQLSTHHQEGAAPWYRYHGPPSSCCPWVSPDCCWWTLSSCTASPPSKELNTLDVKR